MNEDTPTVSPYGLLTLLGLRGVGPLSTSNRDVDVIEACGSSLESTVSGRPFASHMQK